MLKTALQNWSEELKLRRASFVESHPFAENAKGWGTRPVALLVGRFWHDWKSCSSRFFLPAVSIEHLEQHQRQRRRTGVSALHFTLTFHFGGVGRIWVVFLVVRIFRGGMGQVAADGGKLHRSFASLRMTTSFRYVVSSTCAWISILPVSSFPVSSGDWRRCQASR
jgi:hypothetical protein